MPDLISLADVIQQLKADLKPIQDDPLFYLDSIEIEAQVVVSREHGGDIKLSVLNFLGAEANAKHEAAYTQSIKINLSPIFSKEELKNALPPDRLSQAKQSACQTVMRGDGSGVKVKIHGE